MKKMTTVAVAVLIGGLLACKESTPTPPPTGTGAAGEMPPGHPDMGAAGALPAPPSGEIAGELMLGDGVKDKVKAGEAIFVVARNAATNNLIAAARFVAGDKFPVPFKLTGSDVMHAQTSLSGKVKLEARVDKDGDAMTKNPGDVVGETKDLVAIPASGVVITLDKVL